MREFYFFYLKSRKAKGLLPEPFKLFKYMWLCFNDLGNLEILKAMYQNRTIASSVIFKYADTVVIEYCFGDDAYRSFGVNQFLFWEIIKSAKMQDYNYVDFGRTSDKNVTLQQFKLRWNTKREKLIYSYLPCRGTISHLRKNNNSHKIMKYAVKYTPRLVNRATGRVLYRYLI